MFISILAIVWLLLIVIWAFYQLKQFYKFSQEDNVGLVTTNLNNIKSILDQIIQKQQKTSNQNTSYFIELGSGRGIISNYISKNYLFKKVIAIENDWLIHTWAKITHFINYLINYLIKTKLFKHKNFKTNSSSSQINYVNHSVFDYDYNSLNGKKIFYCYLFPQILDKLYKRGVFKNSIVISLSFEITNLEATEVFDIPDGFLQKKLFVYEF